jgi:hypothetical protein
MTFLGKYEKGQDNGGKRERKIKKEERLRETVNLKGKVKIKCVKNKG